MTTANAMIKKAAGARKPKTALDVLDEMEKAPTLNRFFDNNPNKFTDDEILAYVTDQRRSRAQVVEKGDEDE